MRLATDTQRLAAYQKALCMLRQVAENQERYLYTDRSV